MRLHGVSQWEPGAPEPAPWPWAFRPTLWDQPGPCPFLPAGLQAPGANICTAILLSWKAGIFVSLQLPVGACGQPASLVEACRWELALWSGALPALGASCPPYPAALCFPLPRLLPSSFTPFLFSLPSFSFCSASSLCFLSSLTSSLLLFSISLFVLSLSPFVFFLCPLWLFDSYSSYTAPLYSPTCAKNFPPAASRQRRRRRTHLSLFCSCTPNSGTQAPLCVTRDRTHLDLQDLFCHFP